MLAVGTRLGPYEVVGPLGVGGMGEVYRARDSRLSRSVALKILPDAFARDADRVARFQREAEMLASLSHPHIGAIYDVALDGDVRFLVLELIEGDTLADRIAKGPVALAAALDIARQIADALEAAHARGIIHRDLKPANIKVAADGKVKVLDFGLAKMRDPELEGSAAETELGVTSAGTIIGTTAYMSPEQVKGQDADRRSDVWAFGCVLFEMLTGRQVFDGGSSSEVLANVLKTEPDWARLPAGTPESIRRLLRRCLEKSDKRRLRDIGDARLEIDEAGDAREARPQVQASNHRTERRMWAAAVAMFALVAVGAGLWAMRSSAAPPSSPEMRFDIATPSVLDPYDLTAMAVSADGRNILFVARADGQSVIMLRAIDSAVARPLAGTSGAGYPFWSPDGRSIGFFADGALKRLDLDGGLVRPLAKATLGVGGTWNRDGVILFSPNPASSVWRVPSEGGSASEVTRLDVGTAGHSFAHFLPDGRHFLYYMTAGPERRGIYLADLDGGSPRRLMDADSSAVYSRGHLLFIRQTNVFAQVFDAASLELRGSPFLLADQALARAGGLWVVPPAAAGEVIVFRAGTAQFGKRFVWFDRTGPTTATVGDGLETFALSMSPSPDGNQLVFFQRAEATSDLWTVDTRRGIVSRLTADPGENIFPVWSRDGGRVIFTSNRTGQFGLYQKRPSSNDPAEMILPPSPSETFANDTSRDGRTVLYQQRSPTTGWDMWQVGTGGGKPSAVLQTDADEGNAALSPDMKWVAYSANGSGRFEIYLRAFPGPGSSVQVSAKGGTQVRWRSDGRELYYVAQDSKLMAVSVGAASGDRPPALGTPVALFSLSLSRNVNPPPNTEYFVAPDGQRFLVNSMVQDTASAPLRVILNWTGQRP